MQCPHNSNSKKQTWNILLNTKLLHFHNCLALFTFLLKSESPLKRSLKNSDCRLGVCFQTPYIPFLLASDFYYQRLSLTSLILKIPVIFVCLNIHSIFSSNCVLYNEQKNALCQAFWFCFCFFRYWVLNFFINRNSEGIASDNFLPWKTFYK